MAKNQRCTAMKEARVLEVAADISSNNLAAKDVAKKYCKKFGITWRTFDRMYMPHVNDVISKIANEKFVPQIEKGIGEITELVPDALKVLKDAMKDKSEANLPTRNAISAADIILRKALPDKIEQKQVISNPLADELKAMREQLQNNDKKE
jgi:hypothetical protein